VELFHSGVFLYPFIIQLRLPKAVSMQKLTSQLKKQSITQFLFLESILSRVVLLAMTIFPASLIAQNAPVTYPKIAGYVGAVHTIVTYGKNSPQYNFDGAYVGGLATGINIWKSARVGFSFEFVPFIRASEGVSKMSNFLFHPGVLFALGKGYTLATRAAFETGGRYGLTPVFNKIVKRNKTTSYYVAIPVPARFGNDLPATVGLAFQFGVAF